MADTYHHNKKIIQMYNTKCCRGNFVSCTYTFHAPMVTSRASHWRTNSHTP